MSIQPIRPPRPWMLRSSQTLVGRLTRSLIVFVGGIWLLSALGVAVYIDLAINRNFDNELIEVGERLFDAAAHEYEVRRSDAAAASHASRLLDRPTLFPDSASTFRLVDAAGKALLATPGVPAAGFGAGLAPGFEDVGDFRVLTIRHPHQSLYFQIADSLAERRKVLNTALLTLLLPMIGAMPLLALALRRIARNELAGLHSLTSEIRTRSSADLRPIHHADLPRELRILNDHINQLLARLSHSLDVERALAANAAHELRTPLAAMRLRLQSALDHEPRSEHIQAALDAVQALGHRTEKLLQLSRAESGASLTRGEVDLVRLVGAVAQEFWQHGNCQSRLDLKVPDVEIRPVLGDCAALAIAGRNLIENALRYGDGHVLLEVDAQGILIVRDWGCGVTPAQLRTLRQRHVRHHAHGAGYGLGLSIVQTIIEKHGGWLELRSPPLGASQGFEARIRLQSV